MRAKPKGAKYRNLIVRGGVICYQRAIAGNDAGNGVVANLLRDDSAGRAGSASAALGGAACLDRLIRLLARAVGNRAHGITAFKGRTVEQLAGDACFHVAKRDPGFLGSVVREQILETVVVDIY